jgi:REP element-mobilizing transposase RayT
MAHAYYSLLVHCVFSTKDRQRLITPEIQADLWPYMGGIARTIGTKALAIGGLDDHSHMLLSLPAAMPVAKAIPQIKAGSSLWLRSERSRRNFNWQEGYGAFSIGQSQVTATVNYVLRQEGHHRRFDFQAEFLTLLKKYEVDCDPRPSLGLIRSSRAF